MEALLAQLPPPPLPLTGAEAWEAVDLAAGVTVKRVPETTEGYAHAGAKTLSGLGSGHSSGGSSKGKPERRVVTAIFAPTPTPAAAVAAASGAADGALKALEASVALAAAEEAAGSGPALTASPEARPLPVPPSQPQSRAGSPSKRPLPPTPGDADTAPRASRAQSTEVGNAEAEREQMMLEKMLEDEILATRALLETFRMPWASQVRTTSEEASAAPRGTIRTPARTDGSREAGMVGCGLGFVSCTRPSTQTNISSSYV